MSLCSAAEKLKIATILLLEPGKHSDWSIPPTTRDASCITKFLASTDGEDHRRISSSNASLQYGYYWRETKIQKHGKERNFPIGRKN